MNDITEYDLDFICETISDNPSFPIDFIMSQKTIKKMFLSYLFNRCIPKDEGDFKGHRGKLDYAACELGREGGLKGGVARAKSLSPERRSEIASKAAMARWSK